jgi:hypothetical protein
MNQRTSRRQMEKEYNAAIERLTKEHGHLVAPINFTEAFCIVGTLQFALRHPEFPKASRSIVEAFIRGIQEAVKKEPALNQVIEMGFDPECDVNPEINGHRILERIDGYGDFFKALRDGFEKAMEAGVKEMGRQAKEEQAGFEFNTFAEMQAENGQGFKLTIEFYPPTIPMIPSRN